MTYCDELHALALISLAIELEAMGFVIAPLDLR